MILDCFYHYGVLELGLGDLHAPGPADPGVRNVPVAGDLVGGIDDYDSLLQIIRQNPGRFAQQRGLAHARPSHQENALAGFHKVPNYVDGSINGAPYSASETDNLANSITHCGDSMKGPLASGSIVPGETADSRGNVLDVFAGNQRMSQINGSARIACFGLPSQVQNGFDQ